MEPNNFKTQLKTSKYRGAFGIDLDQTLLTDDKEILRDSLELMDVLEKCGILPVFITARPERIVTNLAKKYDPTLTKGFTKAFIFNNGAVVKADGNYISKKVFTKEQLQTLRDICKECGISYDVGTTQEQIISSAFAHDRIEEKLHRTLGMQMHVEDDIDTFIDNNSDINFFCITENDGGKLEAARAQIAALPYNFQISGKNSERIRNGYLDFHDVTPSGVSKASAFQLLLDHYGIPKDMTFAIGDGSNDKEMLQFVAHPFAMQNARDSIKAVAKYITSHDNNPYEPHNTSSGVSDAFFYALLKSTDNKKLPKGYKSVPRPRHKSSDKGEIDR